MLSEAKHPYRRHHSAEGEGFLATLGMTEFYRIGLISRKLVPIDKE
jgi:hypothetical protein